MLDIILYKYKKEILRKRSNYIKSTTGDIISEGCLIVGAILVVAAAIINLFYTLDNISLCLMVVGLVMMFAGIAIILILNQIYFKSEVNVCHEKIWEQERVKELKEYLNENFQIMNHKETLQFLIDECDQKNKTSSEKALFSSAIGFFVGISGSMLSALMDDLGKSTAEGQRWPLYIFGIFIICLIVLVLFGFDSLISNYRKRQVNVLNSLRSDLKYILSTLNTCKKMDGCSLDNTEAATHRRRQRKKKIIFQKFLLKMKQIP